MALINATKWLSIAVKYQRGSSQSSDRVNRKRRGSTVRVARLARIVESANKGTNASNSRIADDTQRARINRFAKWRAGKRSVKPRDIESSGASRVMMAGPGSCSITKIVWKRRERAIVEVVRIAHSLLLLRASRVLINWKVKAESSFF